MNRRLLTRVLVILAIFCSGVIVYALGQSFGWWSLPAPKVVIGMAVLSIAFLFLGPVIERLERVKSVDPIAYWFGFLLLLILTGILTAVLVH